MIALIDFYILSNLFRLRSLLSMEEEGYISEMISKQETTLEKQARMREKAKKLREKREEERMDLVEKKLDQRWRYLSMGWVFLVFKNVFILLENSVKSFVLLNLNSVTMRSPDSDQNNCDLKKRRKRGKKRVRKAVLLKHPSICNVV